MIGTVIEKLEIQNNKKYFNILEGKVTFRADSISEQLITNDMTLNSLN